MMNNFLLGLLVCIAFVFSNSVQALWLDCNNCDNAAMEKLVKSKGRFFGVGRHEVSVINFDQSIYQIFQVDVVKLSGGRKKGTRDEWRIVVSVIDNPMKRYIESDLRRSVKAIDDFLAIVGGKIILPKDGPFRTVGDALLVPSDFDSYLNHYINNEQNDISHKLRAINLALSEAITNMTAQVSAGQLASLSTQLMSFSSTHVEFPDGSLLRVEMNFGHDAFKGTIILAKSTQQAETADNQRVPLSGRTANGFSTNAQHEGADLTGIVEWFNSIGINTASGSQTGEGGGTCRTVHIDCNEHSRCTFVLRCRE